MNQDTHTLACGPQAPEHSQALHALAEVAAWIADHWPEDDHRLALRINELTVDLISYPRVAPKGETRCR